MSPSAPAAAPTGTRMSAEARRELILAAATRAFAEQGYAATTTDTVAREAGVSQPYVVRMFGTKLRLFVEVFGHAAERIIEAFERELDAQPFDRLAVAAHPHLDVHELDLDQLAQRVDRRLLRRPGKERRHGREQGDPRGDRRSHRTGR